MADDPIRTASKPLDMQVLDCIVREQKKFGNSSICHELRGDLVYYHFREHWPHTIFKRLSELRDAGLIRKVGERKPYVSARRSQSEWVPTAKGRKVHARWRAARDAAKTRSAAA